MNSYVSHNNLGSRIRTNTAWYSTHIIKETLDNIIERSCNYIFEGVDGKIPINSIYSNALLALSTYKIRIAIYTFRAKFQPSARKIPDFYPSGFQFGQDAQSF